MILKNVYTIKGNNFKVILWQFWNFDWVHDIVHMLKKITLELFTINGIYTYG